MPRHPSKTTLIQGPSSIGKTFALKTLAARLGDQVTLLTTTGEEGFIDFSVEAIREAKTPYLAIDEITDLGTMNPKVFAQALQAMAEHATVRHLILVTWSERSAKEEGFIFPRGTKTVSMRARRSALVLEDDVIRVEEPAAEAA